MNNYLLNYFSRNLNKMKKLNQFYKIFGKFQTYFFTILAKSLRKLTCRSGSNYYYSVPICFVPIRDSLFPY